jgi:hypothetical protein
MDHKRRNNQQRRKKSPSDRELKRAIANVFFTRCERFPGFMIWRVSHQERPGQRLDAMGANKIDKSAIRHNSARRAERSCDPRNPNNTLFLRGPPCRSGAEFRLCPGEFPTVRHSKPAQLLAGA